MSHPPATDQYTVCLLDATGRIVRTWTLQVGNPPPTLEVSDLATGTYQVLVKGLQADGSVMHQSLHLTND